jgi:DNA-binding transcriptional LysR family regulator
MDQLTQLRVFVRVAERASFSAAARDLGLTQSAVSKAISALERRLGARLVSRSTRRVALTAAGRRYVDDCRPLLAELDRIDARVAAAQHEAAGPLTIAAPIPFGLKFISPRVARFHLDHPAISVRLDLNDRHADLVADDTDVAIRLGRVGGQGLVARRFGASPVVVVAAPAYVRAHGAPRAPADLGRHSALLYTNDSAGAAWRFDRAGRSHSVAVTGRYRANNLLALKDAALAGAGIARLPLWMADDDIRAGTLQPLLDAYRCPPYDIHAVFSSARQIPERVRMFVDFLQNELAAIPQFLGTRPAPPRKAGGR